MFEEKHPFYFTMTAEALHGAPLITSAVKYKDLPSSTGQRQCVTQSAASTSEMTQGEIIFDYFALQNLNKSAYNTQFSTVQVSMCFFSADADITVSALFMDKYLNYKRC